VHHIVNNGSDWFRGLSLNPSGGGGTKIYGVSGKVKIPGLWELPMGTTVGEVLGHAGGMQDGLKLRGLVPGGASTGFLTDQHLNVRMDFDTPTQFGSRMGTGTMIVLDDQTCPVGMVHNLIDFFRRESCGWCTPCRDGLPWTTAILAAIESGQGEMADLEILQEHVNWLGPGRTFCALAPGAMEPLGTALKYFHEDFERHIKDKRCPWKKN
jgi:NADH-quinone oxidoreductase subunit F